jgi:hypothetical protein
LDPLTRKEKTMTRKEKTMTDTKTELANAVKIVIAAHADAIAEDAKETQTMTETENLPGNRDDLAILARELAPDAVRIIRPGCGDLADTVVVVGADGREVLLYRDEDGDNKGWCWRTQQWDDAENYYVDHDGDPLDSRGELAGLLRDLAS